MLTHRVHHIQPGLAPGHELAAPGFGNVVRGGQRGLQGGQAHLAGLGLRKVGLHLLAQADAGAVDVGQRSLIAGLRAPDLRERGQARTKAAGEAHKVAVDGGAVGHGEVAVLALGTHIDFRRQIGPAFAHLGVGDARLGLQLDHTGAERLGLLHQVLRAVLQGQGSPQGLRQHLRLQGAPQHLAQSPQSGLLLRAGGGLVGLGLLLAPHQQGEVALRRDAVANAAQDLGAQALVRLQAFIQRLALEQGAVPVGIDLHHAHGQVLARALQRGLAGQHPGLRFVQTGR